MFNRFIPSLVTFRTAKPVLVACGQQAVVDSSISTKPLIGMTIGSILVAGDSEIMVEQISDNPHQGITQGWAGCRCIFRKESLFGF